MSKMKIKETNINALYHFIENGELNRDDVACLIYSNYSENEINGWLDKLATADDSSEMLEILRSNFDVDEGLSKEEEIGEIADCYFNGNMKLRTVVSHLYEIICLPNVEHSDKQAVYEADDLFDWNDEAEYHSKPIIEPILQRHLSKYETIRDKFKT